MDPNLPSQNDMPQVPQQPVEPQQPISAHFQNIAELQPPEPTPNPEPIQAFTQQQPKAPSGSPKILRLILLIIVVMIVSSGGTYLALKNKKTTPAPIPTQPLAPTIQPTSTPTPSPDPTASWKTYVSKDNKFTFKYPSSWYYQPFSEVEDGSSIDFFLEGTKADESFGDHKGNDVFRINFGEAAYTFNELKTKIYPKAEQITVAGKPALKTSSRVEIFIGPSEKYILGMTIHDESKRYIDQILSTLKFIEPSPTSSAQVSDAEKKLIDAWIVKNNLNEFGDLKDTVYAGGTPLFDEKTGKTIDKYDYILLKHPTRPWNK